MSSSSFGTTQSDLQVQDRKKNDGLGLYITIAVLVAAAVAGLALWGTYVWFSRRAFTVFSNYNYLGMTSINTAPAKTQIGTKYVAFQFPPASEVATDPVIIDNVTYANFASVPSTSFYWSNPSDEANGPLNVLGVTFQYGSVGSTNFSTKTFVVEFTSEPSTPTTGEGLVAAWTTFAASLPANPTSVYVAMTGSATNLFANASARQPFFAALDSYSPTVQIEVSLANAVCFCYAVLPINSSNAKAIGVVARYYVSSLTSGDPGNAAPLGDHTYINQGTNFVPLCPTCPGNNGST